MNRTSIFILLYLAASPVLAKSRRKSFGTLDVSKFTGESVPAYRDVPASKDAATYRLDMGLNFALNSAGTFWLTMGFDSHAGETQFTQAAGRAGLELGLSKKVSVYAYHRSEHAFDRATDLPGNQRFISEDRIGVRYRFGIGN